VGPAHHPRGESSHAPVAIQHLDEAAHQQRENQPLMFHRSVSEGISRPINKS
jgi:hypothetical protein